MATDGKDTLLSPMMCLALWATKHEVKHCIQGKILNDCPLIELVTCKDCKHRPVDDSGSIEPPYTNIAFGTPIPNNATNKDVFKAVFGYDPATDAVVCNKEDWCGASDPCNYCTSNPNKIGREEDWWNEPFKRGEEE